MRRKATRTLLLGVPLLVAAFFAVVPTIPQDPTYHDFADQRPLFGIPHFWNVVSNLPFVLVGFVGMRKVWRGRLQGGLPDLRAAYFLFFLGLLLTGFGSAYYHLAPSNRTLVWDRLPMAVTFMAFFSAVVGEHWSVRLGRRALAPLVVLALLSVLYWNATEFIGHGDLRPYVLVQFLPMLLLPVVLLGFPSAVTGTGYLWAVLAGYGVAKVCEWQDAAVLQILGQLSGHTLKHVSAAAAGYVFLLALERRHLNHAAHSLKR